MAGASPTRDSRWLRHSVVALAAIVMLVMMTMFSSTLLRAKPSPRIIDTPIEQPMTLTNVVKQVPADSWKVIPLNVPYSGTLEVEIGVTRGNPLNVFVTTPDDLQAMNGDQITTVRHHPGFEATTSKMFKREARLVAGNYYLVLQDPSMGNLSSAASDVSIRAALRP
jgi:hypothetical protein